MNHLTRIFIAARWKRAILWVAGLAPLFFISYNFTNQVASQRPDVASLVFAWEHAIPLWPWTIIPYWSIDLLYGFSFLLFIDSRSVDRHGLRLLSVQIICVACFLLFPLHFSFERPQLFGLFGSLFDLLMGFDKPYNQAPSLHIAILAVLWPAYAARMQGVFRWLLHVWFFLIGLSVLTTWQHHFIDVPTGALVGCLAIWMWPIKGPSLISSAACAKTARHKKLGLCYLGAACFLAVVAGLVGGGGLWLFWPALSLFLVAFNYLFLGATAFQKQANGSFPINSWLLFGPYILGAWINSRCWTSKQTRPAEICPGIDLGRMPSRHDFANYAGIVDLCAELPAAPVQSSSTYCLRPVLDLTTPSLDDCQVACLTIDAYRHQGRVLVCCALGYSRSATIMAAWLLYSGQCDSLTAATRLIQSHRPGAVFNSTQLKLLQQWQNLLIEEKTCVIST